MGAHSCAPLVRWCSLSVRGSDFESVGLARSPPPLRGGGIISLLAPLKGEDSSENGAPLKGKET